MPTRCWTSYRPNSLSQKKIRLSITVIRLLRKAMGRSRRRACASTRRSINAQSRTTAAHVAATSETFLVPEKPLNKGAGSAAILEKRGVAKGSNDTSPASLNLRFLPSAGSYKSHGFECRFGEQEPLHQINSTICKEIPFLRMFDTFCNDFNSEL